VELVCEGITGNRSLRQGDRLGGRHDELRKGEKTCLQIEVLCERPIVKKGGVPKTNRGGEEV